MTTPSLLDLAERPEPVYTTPKKETRGSRKSLDGDRMAALFQSRANTRVSALELERDLRAALENDRE